ncbi:hypothetical protein TNCV_1355441 [Trichonephila clavipes]|uniref:Uncharacterized protein n=1 Tax=Trichonephila clavipes TaxID=2585209 RepID=A0A8X6S9F0_TRICX|nr:hypothetical protein TNCV_1355441 [Trichonephila clavipes]
MNRVVLTEYNGDQMSREMKENPKKRNSNAHYKRLQPQTTKWKRAESRPTIERETQQGGPVRSRNGRRRNDSPYIEERTRSNNRNTRRGGDQQRQDQERQGACTKMSIRSLSLEILIMLDPSPFANPTPLAHTDTSRDVLPRGGTSQVNS